MVILIPAYEPDAKLVRLVESIRFRAPRLAIVVADDGSGPDYASVFTACRSLGCEVIGHDTNRGKGFTLKEGFAHIVRAYPADDVVCADCDGQHTLEDILRVAAAVGGQGDGMVLGARQFAGDVPVRSRFGNSVTRMVFGAATGRHLQDTQTGLRGYASNMLGWLQTVPGDRFEYELELLLAAERLGIPVSEIPIETVYLHGNESSHFRTFADSARVYVPVLKFSASSLAAFALDTTVFFAMMGTTGNLPLSIVAARSISAFANFSANRSLVFGDAGRSKWSAAGRYAVLAGSILLANIAVMSLLTERFSVPLVPAKFLTEILLFIASYQAQRRFVFAAQCRPRDVVDRGEVVDRGDVVVREELVAANR
jgi:glycosyltransferase involved in cell wall biosynthesis